MSPPKRMAADQPSRQDEHLQRLRDVALRVGREPAFVTRCSPKVRIAHPTISPGPWSWNGRCISDHAFLYVRKGSGIFIANGIDYAFEDRCLLVCLPGSPHGLRVPRPLDMHNIHFDLVQRSDSGTADYLLTSGKNHDRHPAGSLPVSSHETGYLPACIRINDPQCYESLFWTIYRLYPMPGIPERLLLKSAMIELMALVYRSADAHGAPIASNHRKAMDDAMDFIARNYATRLTVERMARHCALGASSFSRLFKRCHGMTPMTYLRRIRVERAKSELMDSENPIKRIAELTGFANVHHFTRVFTKLAESSPAAFRKRKARSASADK